MINWIVIDDVNYQWNGRVITCTTDVGYSLLINDNKLENIDVLDKENNPCGHLSVNFSTDEIYYNSSGELFDDKLITYHQNGEYREVSLSEIIKLDDFAIQNQLDDNQDEIWSEIANSSHIKISDITENSVHYEQILETKEMNLDLTLSSASDDINGHYEHHGLIDFELMYVQAEIDFMPIKNIDNII